MQILLTNMGISSRIEPLQKVVFDEGLGGANECGETSAKERLRQQIIGESAR